MNETIDDTVNSSVATANSTLDAKPMRSQLVLLPSPVKERKRQPVTDDMPTLPRVWVHRDGVFKKMFKCRHCPHVSKKRTVIFEHEKMHLLRDSPGSKATYHCQYCNYSCMNGGILTSHMRVHKAQTATNFYINDNLDSVAASGAGKSRWTSTPKATGTARKGLNRAKLNETAEQEESNMEERYEMGTPAFNPKPKSKIICCEFCPAKFSRMDKKMMHIKCHGLDLKYKCPHCCYSAKHRPHIHRHVVVHTPEYSKKFGFPPTVNAVRNLNTKTSSIHHSNPSQLSPGGSSVGMPDGKAFTCTQCPAVFLKESTLLYHLKMHDGNAKYKCDHCSYSVFNYSNLIRHARFHGVELPAEPPGINATGTPDSSLSESKIKEVEEETATFKCPKCPAVFDEKGGYDVHAGLHGSRQWFKCDRCDYSVKYEANLIHHRYLHDVRDEGGKTSANASNALDESRSEISIDMSHEEIKTPTTSRKTPAEDKRDDNRQTVMDGEAAGSEVKRLFQCPKCPYTHLRKDAVQSHMKRHSAAASDARCPHCDYGSNMQSFLREHIKLHFDPHRLRQVEEFAHWEELEVWVRSGNHKTLIYRYALGEKVFTENDCRTENIGDLARNAIEIETLQPVVEDVTMVDDDVESNVEDRDNSIVTTGDETEDKEMEYKTVEEEEEEEDDKDDEKESDMKINEKEESMEQSEPEAMLIDENSSVPDNVSESTESTVSESAGKFDIVEEEVPENKVEEKVETSEDEKPSEEEKTSEIVEKEIFEDVSEVPSPESVEEKNEVEVIETEKETEVVEITEEVIEKPEEIQPEIVVEKTEEAVEKSDDIVIASNEIETVEIEEKPKDEEVTIVVPATIQANETLVTVEDDDEKVDVEQMEIEVDDEIEVHECSPNGESGEAAAALKAMNPSVATEVTVSPDQSTENATGDVIEEGTVSIDDMITSDDGTLAETCTHA